MSSACGYCKGRRVVKGDGLQLVPCPKCGGLGEKQQRSSLGARRPGRAASYEWDVANFPLTKCVCCNQPALEWHHVIPVQRLRRLIIEPELLDLAIRDVRGQVMVDRLCHERIENAALLIERHELHPEFVSYVIDFDLIAGLPRHLGIDGRDVA